MLLTGYTLGGYLINPIASLLPLDREVIVKEGGVIIEERRNNHPDSTRNARFLLEQANDPKKVFIKQVCTLAQNQVSSIANEVRIVTLLKKFSFHFLPERNGVDPHFHLISYEFIDIGTLKKNISNAEPIHKLFFLFLEKLSPIIVKLHGIRRNVVNDDALFGFNKPLFLQLNKRMLLDFLNTTSNEIKQKAIEVLLQEEVLKRINNIEWEANSLIHFDLKFDNILTDPYKQGSPIKLIDWEMADMGDPHWDIATLWSEILFSFLPHHEFGSAFKLSILGVNHFLKNYHHPFDRNKLVQLFGVVIIQNTFYKKHPSNDITAIEEYLLQAASFICKPENYVNDVEKSNKDTFTETTATDIAPGKSKDKPIPKGGKLRFLEEDLVELKDIIQKNFISKPTETELKNFIYKWFFGEFEPELLKIKKRLETSQEEVAELPDVARSEPLTDRWWVVEDRTLDGRVVARKASIKRFVEQGGFVFASNSRVDFFTPRKTMKDDDYVNLSHTKYSVTRNSAVEDSEDLWILGETRLKQDTPNWIRFYFHLTDNIIGIHHFIHEMAKRLNERQLPFEIKLRNHLYRYFRADSVILFVHRQHFNLVIDPIAVIYKQLYQRGFLRTQTPKFLRKFFKNNGKAFDGISFGENPIDSTESFGNVRAKLISQVLLKKNHWDNPSDWVNIIKKGFIDEGYNIFELYRNPYPKQNEFKYRFDLLQERLRSGFVFEPNYSPYAEFLSGNRYLEAAKKIGFLICREAIWFGDWCNWFSFKKVGSAERPIYQALDQNDKLGVGLFIAGLSLLCPDEHVFRKVALGANNFRQKDKLHEQELYELSEQELYEKYLNEFKLPQISEFKNDLISTLYNDLFRQRKDILAKELIAANIISRHLDMNIPFPNAYVADWNERFGSEFNPTITHGLAALGYFLLDLSEQKAKNKILILKPFEKLFSADFYIKISIVVPREGSEVNEK